MHTCNNCKTEFDASKVGVVVTSRGATSAAVCGDCLDNARLIKVVLRKGDIGLRTGLDARDHGRHVVQARGMTARVDQRLGLTPMLKRLAFHYLQRGLGTFESEHPAYDAVVVRALYDWSTPSNEALPSQGGVVVEFHSGGKRVRWVEFGCRVVGGGGEPVLREV
jgi:hypothetical protein